LDNIPSSSSKQSYPIGIPIGLSHTFQYEDVTGYYNAGYTVTFDDDDDDAAASCSNKTFRKLWVLKMERTSLNRRCEWIDVVDVVDVDETETQLATTTTTPAINDVETTATATAAMPSNNNAVETSQEVTTPANNEVETIDIIDTDIIFPTSTSSTNTASCNIRYTPSCSVSNVTATSTVYFLVQQQQQQPTHQTQSNQNFGKTYNATVIFHWGDSQTITTGSRQYRIGDPIGVSNTHSYDTTVEGKYYVGYTLVFEDDDDDGDNAVAAALGCSGKSYDAFYLLEMIPGSRCFWEEWGTSVSSSSSLVGGSPTTPAPPAPATTAATLVDASMPSGIPMENNMLSLTNNDGDGNNEGANTTTTTTTTSEPTVSLSPTDISPPNEEKWDSNGATSSGETTLGFFYCTTMYLCGVSWCLVSVVGKLIYGV